MQWNQVTNISFRGPCLGKCYVGRSEHILYIESLCRVIRGVIMKGAFSKFVSFNKFQETEKAHRIPTMAFSVRRLPIRSSVLLFRTSN